MPSSAAFRPPLQGTGGAVAVSALTGDGIDRLLEAIDLALPVDPTLSVTLHLPAADGATLALLHQFGRVIKTRYSGNHLRGRGHHSRIARTTPAPRRPTALTELVSQLIPHLAGGKLRNPQPLWITLWESSLRQALNHR